MASRPEETLSFVTWNTRGLKTKMDDVFDKLRDIKCDVVFLQETHIGPDCCRELENALGWKVYFSVDSCRSKGVAILIRNGVPFEYVCHDEDSCGRYFVLFCRLHEELYTLVNVYKHKEDRTVLGRLKNYLLETAEGMLLVGGDFNIVLDPIFDRRSSVDFVYHSQFRSILEDFTTTLNLRDTWSYKHPTSKGFTQLTLKTDSSSTGQRESQSRLDMFFMQEATMERLCSCEVKSNKIKEKILSDHDLLVVQLKVQQSFKNIKPHVVSMMDTSQQRRKPARELGKISGAEILNAIKSLTNSNKNRPGQTVEYYKKRRCPMTEVLKQKFNQMLSERRVDPAFKKSYQSGNRQIFSVEYLIFTQILSNRLNVFITPSFRRMKKENLETRFTVIFNKGLQKVSWSFLKACLKNLKKKHSAPSPNFDILGALLPSVPDTYGELRYLQNGCPLTNPILKLALSRLNTMLTTEIQCTTTVCCQRQALLIHSTPDREFTLNDIEPLLTRFKRVSGIRLRVN